MTYPLGTTLIFTSLTQASAAADLFGIIALNTFNHFTGDWEEGFCASVNYFNHEGILEIERPEKWRIVLDTEEKVGWFRPQAGDGGYLALYNDKREHGVLIERDKIQIWRNGETMRFEQTEFCTEKRNGLPFPTPQKVELPKKEKPNAE